MIIAASHGHEPAGQLQTGALTLIFGIALISAGRTLRQTGRLPAWLDLERKVSGPLAVHEVKSAGVVKLGAVLIGVGSFFIFGTVCLVLGAMGV